MIKEAIILAGGFGTRLKEVIGDEIPKPMAPVNGRPFLEYLLHYLDKWGVSRVIMATGYKHEVIEAYFGKRFNEMDIIYSVEEEALGTGGAVKQAMGFANGYSVYVINGDTYFDVNLWKLANYNQMKDADACMTLRKMGDVSRYGSVKIGEDNRIESFIEKGSETGMGYINGGTYIFKRKTLFEAGLPDKFSLETDYFEKFYKKHDLYGVRCFSYFLDIGVPEDYKEAAHALEGLII